MSERWQDVRKRKLNHRAIGINNLKKAREVRHGIIDPTPIDLVQPCACQLLPRPDVRNICACCGSKSIIDTNEITLSNHKPLSDYTIGRDCLRDTDYQNVMDLLPQEMVQEFASWFVMDKNKGGVGKTPVTKAELQAELDSLTTKQIVAKLVKIRRDNVLSCPKLS